MIHSFAFFFLLFIAYGQVDFPKLSVAGKVEYHIFHYQYENAVKTLIKNKEKISDEKYTVFKSFIYFYRYFSDQPSKRDKKFLDSISVPLEKIIQNEETILKSDNYHKILMLGGAFGFKGMAEYLRKERFSALKNADHAKEILEELIEKSPLQKDALFGIGMYNHALSKPPGVIKFLLSILGYSGDYDLGTKQLFEASRFGTDTKVQSILYLINHAIYEDRHYEKIDSVFKLIPVYLQKTPMYYYKKIHFDLALNRHDSLLNNYLRLAKHRVPGYIKNKAHLFLAKSYIKNKQTDIAYRELKNLENSRDRLLGGMYYELREAFADYYVAIYNYQEAAVIYEYILDNSKVDRRLDRVEAKYEAIEDYLD